MKTSTQNKKASTCVSALVAVATIAISLFVSLGTQTGTVKQAYATQPCTVLTTQASKSSNATTSTSAKKYARKIFKEYNNFRARKGLKRVKWNSNCYKYALNSAKGCAACGSLTHRLGIPASKQYRYSDILAYYTWQASPSETISRWEGSPGHRKMMQCETATRAAVGAYKDPRSGKWFLAIVYNFDGCNQSGQ